jgi:hypothetical protein
MKGINYTQRRKKTSPLRHRKPRFNQANSRYVIPNETWHILKLRKKSMNLCVSAYTPIVRICGTNFSPWKESIIPNDAGRHPLYVTENRVSIRLIVDTLFPTKLDTFKNFEKNQWIYASRHTLLMSEFVAPILAHERNQLYPTTQEDLPSTTQKTAFQSG